MLEIQDILMGANTDSPALNDFAKLVAQLLPPRDLATADMAQIVLNAAFDVRKNVDDYATDYPHLCKFAKEQGDMCKLAAKLSTVLLDGAEGENIPYAKAYQVDSARFFGKA